MKKSELDSQILVIDGKETELNYNVPVNCNAVVLAVHGMMEHSKRYFIPSEPLEKGGFGFAAFDLPGHGMMEKANNTLGNWPIDGFEYCVKQVIEAASFIKEKFNKKTILLGHSMGSFLAMKVIGMHGHKFAGCIFSGTNDADSALLLNAGIFAAKTISFFKGKDYKSKFLYNMAFGAFNNEFKPHRTRYDWLSRDEIEVDKYIDDELCGFIASAWMFKEMAALMSLIYKKENISGIPKELPIFMISGSMDPVGEFGKGPVKLKNRLNAAGMENVSYKLYENARHECLNETNRSEVIVDIVAFCNRITG